MKGNLKPGWKLVKFGDIAQNVAVRVDPANANTDIYIGLEHLDPSTLHLRQWGHPSDVTGQKLKFKKGDVIFGRRRAYQRKLAIAEFDGICSAHAMVVRAKPKVILPEYLPFFLKSDMFMERAIEISVGSLSPTINWKTLSVQEFPLPPLEEQRCIAEILWAADTVIESYNRALKHLNFFRNIFFIEKCFLNHSQQYFQKTKRISNGWPVKNINELFQLRTDKSLPPHSQIEYLGLEHFDSGAFTLPRTGKSVGIKSTCNTYKPNDLLYGKLRPNLDKATIVNSEGVCSTEILVITSNNKIIPELLIHHLHSPKFVFWNSYRAFGSKMPRTSIEIISKYKIPVPPIEEQITIVKYLQKIANAEHLIKEKINKLKSIQYQYINRFISY